MRFLLAENMVSMLGIELGIFVITPVAVSLKDLKTSTITFGKTNPLLNNRHRIIALLIETFILLYDEIAHKFMKHLRVT